MECQVLHLQKEIEEGEENAQDSGVHLLKVRPPAGCRARRPVDGSLRPSGERDPGCLRAVRPLLGCLQGVQTRHTLFTTRAPVVPEVPAVPEVPKVPAVHLQAVVRRKWRARKRVSEGADLSFVSPEH